MIRNEARVLYSLLRGQPRTGSLAERLQAFYGPQADHYDHFRERLLQGRQQLAHALDPQPGERIVELGAGTGRNLLFFGERIRELECATLVDLCPALLNVAHQRYSHRDNVHIVEADAITWQPPHLVDRVYFSYSLTMMPDWRGAIENALRMLKPGGTLGVVDFYVSEVRPATGLTRHGALTRMFWPRWFAHDGVRPSAEHLPTLRAAMPAHTLDEKRARIPYLPVVTVPYYIFLGRRPDSNEWDTRVAVPLEVSHV